MKINRPGAVVLLAALASVVPVHAQGTHADAAQRCEREVREYLQAMQFIRSAAGGNIGDRVAAGIASEDNVRKIAQQQGHCAAAQFIRERTARR